MIDRAAFWRFCRRAEMAARNRGQKFSVPCSVNAHDIDELLVDNKWLCQVTGIPLRPVKPGDCPYRLDPFGPSLDRIVSAKGYVRGNVRVVCNMANMAMNEWGLDNLLILLRAMNENQSMQAHAIRQNTQRIAAANRGRTNKNARVVGAASKPNEKAEQTLY